MNIKFKKLHENAIIPSYKHAGDSGFDFHALETIKVQPLEIVLVRTGLSCELEQGTELQIRPRSGISTQWPNYVSNNIGTVDSSYRGEIMIIVTNNTFNKVMEIEAGARIAQGVVCPVIRCDIEVVEEVSDTTRGDGGFGSTGDK